ncbi:hypothetical protein JCM33774_11830 [Actinophytocola sp. KF-1]
MCSDLRKGGVSGRGGLAGDVGSPGGGGDGMGVGGEGRVGREVEGDGAGMGGMWGRWCGKWGTRKRCEEGRGDEPGKGLGAAVGTGAERRVRKGVRGGVGEGAARERPRGWGRAVRGIGGQRAAVRGRQ